MTLAAFNARVARARTLPGLAPVAIQQGRYVAKTITREARNIRDVDFDEAGRARRMSVPERAPFHYVDKGIMATVGRSRAVMQFKGLRWSGFFAWMAWLVVHIYFLVGYRTSFLVLYEWAWAYLRNKRGSRIIEQPWAELMREQTSASPLQQAAGKGSEPPPATSWNHNSRSGRPS